MWNPQQDLLRTAFVDLVRNNRSDPFEQTFLVLIFYINPAETHTAVGNTSLPADLTSLLRCANPAEGTSLASETVAPALYELFRVGANVCMDHGYYLSWPLQDISY